MLQTLLCQFEEELTAFYRVSFSACALSTSLPLSSSSCCPHVLLPHQPLHMPSPTDGNSIVHKMILEEKYVWKKAVKIGIGADGGKEGDACPVPSSPGVPCAPNYSDQCNGRGRAQSPGLLVPHLPWWNSCCTTNCLQLGDTCPLVISSDYFPQQQGQVHFESFPISLWKCKLWGGRDIVLLFHWVMQIPIPHMEWMNKYPWYKC